MAATGTRIGAYEVIGPLGACGMGEVYQARDTNLKREVAIKVLPESVATARDRLLRFQREAEVLASLKPSQYCGDLQAGAIERDYSPGDGTVEGPTLGPSWREDGREHY